MVCRAVDGSCAGACGGVKLGEWRASVPGVVRKAAKSKFNPPGRTSSEGFLASGFQLTSPPTAKSTQSGYIGADKVSAASSEDSSHPARELQGFHAHSRGWQSSHWRLLSSAALTTEPTRATHSSPRHASHAPSPHSHAPPPRTAVPPPLLPPSTLPHAVLSRLARIPSRAGLASHHFRSQVQPLL